MHHLLKIHICFRPRKRNLQYLSHAILMHFWNVKEMQKHFTNFLIFLGPPLLQMQILQLKIKQTRVMWRHWHRRTKKDTTDKDRKANLKIKSKYTCTIPLGCICNHSLPRPDWVTLSDLSEINITLCNWLCWHWSFESFRSFKETCAAKHHLLT